MDNLDHILRIFDRDEPADQPVAASVGPQRPLRLSVLLPVRDQRWLLPESIDRLLSAPVSTELEIVAVDDASTDGSREVLEGLAAEEPRIRLVRHERRRGWGAAIRTAVEHMTGDVAALQDVPLVYDPAEWGRLMQPIVEDRADAVTGSRLSAPQGLVRGYRGTWLCRGATLAANLLNDLSLTDALSGCKLVRADVLRHLRLRGSGFALEAELIGRLAQWGARLYEMPIAAPATCESDRRGRRVSEVVAALGTMIRCRFFSPRYTDWQRPFSLCVGSGAVRQQRWLLDKVRPYLGSRVLQTGAGVGHVGSRLLDRELLVLLEREPMYASALRHRFSGRQNVLVEETELLSRAQARRWQAERLDTVFCCDYLESAPQDEAALRQFHDMLAPGGRCILVVPAGRWLYSAMDRGLGYVRRYGRKELRAMVEQAGFELVAVRSFGKLAALGRAFSGHLLRRKRLSPMLARWHDRLWALTRWFDFLLPTPGAGLLVVGRKPKDRSQRMAA